MDTGLCLSSHHLNKAQKAIMENADVLLETIYATIPTCISNYVDAEGIKSWSSFFFLFFTVLSKSNDSEFFIHSAFYNKHRYNLRAAAYIHKRLKLLISGSAEHCAAFLAGNSENSLEEANIVFFLKFFPKWLKYIYFQLYVVILYVLYLITNAVTAVLSVGETDKNKFHMEHYYITDFVTLSVVYNLYPVPGMGTPFDPRSHNYAKIWHRVWVRSR